MSLTSLIRAGRGPVWEWFAATFPATREVSTNVNRELRGGSAKEPCAVLPVPGTDHALVGTAVGYLLSAHLLPHALDQTVATNGARQLDRPLRRVSVKPSTIERAVVRRVVELAPWQAILGSTDWTELCGLFAILARFEQYFRAGPAVVVHIGAPVQDHGGDLRALACAIASEPTMRDLEALGHVAVEDHIFVREAAELYIGPNFAQSLALGGADADLIYNGKLVDLKSTAQARVVGRDELWQLIGYLLADTNDAYSIREVGFSALRRRRSIFWSVEDLMLQLGGDEVRSVAELRGEFAALLGSVIRRPNAMQRASLQAITNAN